MWYSPGYHQYSTRKAIFSVELLPGGGQAHHKMDCILTPAFIGSRCRIRGARQHPAKQYT